MRLCAAHRHSAALTQQRSLICTPPPPGGGSRIADARPGRAATVAPDETERNPGEQSGGEAAQFRRGGTPIGVRALLSARPRSRLEKASVGVPLPLLSFVIASGSETIQCCGEEMGCFVAALLAMARLRSGHRRKPERRHHPFVSCAPIPSRFHATGSAELARARRREEVACICSASSLRVTGSKKGDGSKACAAKYRALTLHRAAG